MEFADLLHKSDVFDEFHDLFFAVLLLSDIIEVLVELASTLVLIKGPQVLD